MNLVSYRPLPTRHGRGGGKGVWAECRLWLSDGWHLTLFCQNHKLLVFETGGVRDKLSSPMIRPLSGGTQPHHVGLMFVRSLHCLPLLNDFRLLL